MRDAQHFEQAAHLLRRGKPQALGIDFFLAPRASLHQSLRSQVQAKRLQKRTLLGNRCATQSICFGNMGEQRKIDMRGQIGFAGRGQRVDQFCALPRLENCRRMPVRRARNR